TEKGKYRGGCHVCLPNFGPDLTGTLSQHGFGRSIEWERNFNDEPDAVALTMPLVGDDYPDYAGLRAELRYATSDAGGPHTTLQLNVSNEGSDILRVAPAFHPYFAKGPEDTVWLDGQKLGLAELSEAQFCSGPDHTLVIGGRELRLASEQLQEWAIWTDAPDKYICVEPTLVGPSFSRAGAPDPRELLAPGDIRTYEFQIYA
ncbi:MAG TPA: hypothetical protein VFQ70_03750, partial [Candidatus Saccharimonadaceae bacterium]|nr:hypothetical protein [Candidatus Saccharimonadaceae bacterium]